MPSVYGAWVPNSTANARMRLRVDYNVPTPTAGQTSVTVTGSCYIEVRYSLSDSNNSFSWGGTLISSGSSAKTINVATDGAQQLHTFSQAVTLTNSAQSKTVSFNLSGIDYVGSSYTASVTATISVPAKVVNAPAAPTNFVFTRVSDTRHDGTWTATSTAAAPIVNFEIERWSKSNNNSVYYAYTVPTGSARAWSDTATNPNDVHVWRIRSVNAAGVSSWVYSNHVWTTPAAATNVTLVKSGTDVTVSWTINARDAVSQDLRIKSSSDGGLTWSAYSVISGHTALGPTINSRLVTGLSGAQIHKIGVVSSVSTPVSLYGYSADSATLQMLTAPNAPTPLAPLGVVSTTAITTFQWQHNSIDTTAQTAAAVRHRLIGAPSWVTATATTAQQLNVAAGAWLPGQVEYQIRTKGAHASWSDWSSVATFTVAAPPSVNITVPAGGAVVQSNKLKLTISYTDAQSAAMTGWRAELTQGGQLLEAKTGSKATTSISFDTVLNDLTSYVAWVWVISGTGLTSSPASWSGSTDFLDPVNPTLEAVYNDLTGTMQLAIANYTVGGQAATVSNRIERSDDGGLTWTEIAGSLPLNSGMGDNTVPLNVEIKYRAIAVSSLGTEAIGATVTTTAASSTVWFHGVSGETLRLEFADDISEGLNHDSVLEDYYGDTLPTGYVGIKQYRTETVNGKLIEGYGLTTDWRSLLNKKVFYRDPFGRAFWAMITSEISRSQNRFPMASISLTFTEVMP